MFNTNNAGNEFFQHLSALKQDQDEVREVYYHAILCGFVGQYYYENADTGELGKLKELHARQLPVAPAPIGGLYWRGASRAGAYAGVLTGAVLWTWCLLLPALLQSEGHAPAWMLEGPLGQAWLRPESLFGLTGWDPLTHGVFWSLLGNVAAFVFMSMRHRPLLQDQLAAADYLDPYAHRPMLAPGGWVGKVRGSELLTLAARILRRWGFRRVMVTNALVASLMLCCFGLFRADTPYPLIIGVLLVSGCFRSLQFTSLNAIVYAEVEPARMAQASSLAAMAQQVSLAIGITIGGYALTTASVATGQPMEAVINFSFAFLTVGLVSASSLWMMLKLAPDAGAEMSGKAEPGKEVTDPKPEQRPGN